MIIRLKLGEELFGDTNFFFESHGGYVEDLQLKASGLFLTPSM